MSTSSNVPPHPETKYFPTGNSRLRPHTLEDGTVLLVYQIELASNMNQHKVYRDATVQDLSINIPLVKN
jgi:hypothetical protein